MAKNNPPQATVHSAHHLSKFLKVQPPQLDDLSKLPAEWKPTCNNGLLTIHLEKGFPEKFDEILEKLNPWGRHYGVVRARTGYEGLGARYLRPSELPQSQAAEQSAGGKPPRKRQKKGSKKSAAKAEILCNTVAPEVGIHKQSVFPVSKCATATRKNLPNPAAENINRDSCYFKVLSAPQPNVPAQVWLDTYGSKELKEHVCDRKRHFTEESSIETHAGSKLNNGETLVVDTNRDDKNKSQLSEGSIKYSFNYETENNTSTETNFAVNKRETMGDAHRSHDDGETRKLVAEQNMNGANSEMPATRNMAEKDYLKRVEGSVTGETVIYSNDNEALPLLRDFFNLPVIGLENFKNNKLLETENLVSGIQTPYFYLGTEGATFAVHLEDYVAYSLSYLHVGASKNWVFVCPDDAVKLEELFKSYTGLPLKCSQSVRHGMVYFPTTLLNAAGIRYVEVEQFPGDLIITWPWAYHQGWNSGCNIAEACGYATGRIWPDMMAPLAGIGESEATKLAKTAGGGATAKGGRRTKSNKKCGKGRGKNVDTEVFVEPDITGEDATPILYHKCWAGTRGGKKIGCGQQPAPAVFLGFGENFRKRKAPLEI